MADEKKVLMYKGRPLMRKDNMIYYGSMADSHIVMLQILESEKKQDVDVATKVSVELQLTDPNVRAKDRILKKSVAFSLELRADDRTLTDDDSTGTTQRILQALEQKLGAVLR